MNFMNKTKTLAAAAAMLGAAAMAPAVQADDGRHKGRGGLGQPTIYVVSQDLFYDSIALAELPVKGEFQRLYMTEDGLTSDLGPGDVGYLGGRWWLDANNNNEMDEGDAYFLCPLLGPGRMES